MMRARKVRVLLAAAALLAPMAAPCAEVPAVVPAPVSLVAREGAFLLSDATVLAVDAKDAGAKRVAQRFADLMARTLGVKLAVRDGFAGGAIRFIRAKELAPEGYRI